MPLAMKLLKCLVTILLLISFITYFGVPFVQEYLKQTVVFIERDGPHYNGSFLPSITTWSSVSKKDFEMANFCLNSTETIRDVVDCLKNYTGLKSDNLSFRSCDGTSEKLNTTIIQSYGMVLHGLKLSINASFNFDCILLQLKQNVSLSIGYFIKFYNCVAFNKLKLFSCP